MGIQLPRVIWVTTLLTSASYTPCQDRSIEEKSDFDKMLEMIER